MRKLRYLIVIISLLSCTFFNQIYSQSNSFSPTIKPQVWGQIHYSTSDEESTMFIKRARIGAKGDIYEDIKYAFLFEAANSPYLLQAWIDYNFSSTINLRVGQYKYPFGIEAYPSATTWKFINPSFITDNITKTLGNSGGSFRDIGIQLNGGYNLAKKAKLNYAFMLLNGNGINKKDDNRNKDIALRSSITIDDIFDVGISYFNGKYSKNDLGNFDENSLGFHLQSNLNVNNKELRIQGEYILAKYYDQNKSYRPWGYYFYSTYEVYDNIEAGLRYDYFEKNKFASDISSFSRITFSAGYYFAQKQRINLNYEIIDDSKLSENNDLFTVQFQFAIQ